RPSQALGFAVRTRFWDSASGANQSRGEPCERGSGPRRTRSHFSLVANLRRGSVSRSPQGAIRGGFAVSPRNSGRFARCACEDGALARARRERRASSMSAAWDSSPALSPVPRGERSRDAFNCVPGDQQSAPLINSFAAVRAVELLIIGATAREERRTNPSQRSRSAHERGRPSLPHGLVAVRTMI